MLKALKDAEIKPIHAKDHLEKKGGNKMATDELVGMKIMEVRPMTDEELKSECWEESGDTMVLVLSDGTKLYASQDEEGSGPGTLFGTTAKGKQFGLVVEYEDAKKK
jgi:hypothetical protein